SQPDAPTSYPGDVEQTADTPTTSADPAADPDAKTSSISLASDKESFNIGHAWIMIDKSDGSKDSYGFWPGDMTVLSALRGGSWIGQIMHPDTAHEPDALFTRKVSSRDLERGIQYANSKAHAYYNLLGFNCATFAREMFQVTTGEIPPPG